MIFFFPIMFAVAHGDNITRDGIHS